MNRLINKLRVMAHLLRHRVGCIEAYYCSLYAKLLSDRMNRKSAAILSAKRALRDARDRLAAHAANPRLAF